MSTVTLADLIASIGTDKRYHVFQGGKPVTLFAKALQQDEHQVRTSYLPVLGKDYDSGKYYQWSYAYEVIEEGIYEFREVAPRPLW
jgi:hypothetical protein